jgi:Pathogenicity locus
MNPSKVAREKLHHFSDLPNIGPASAKDFVLLGYKHPLELKGAEPLKLYYTLCWLTNIYQDPCVLDVFISVVDFLDGNPPQAWWHFTAYRKERYGSLRFESSSRAGS